MSASVGHNSNGRVRCIFRAHGERGYTKLCNSFLQDRRLSYETRGLIAMLLSLPDDWEVTVHSIIASGPSGRDKVYRMIREAEVHGYIKPEQARKDAGKFDRQLYLVTDNPTSLIERTALEIATLESGVGPLTDLPLTENTDAAEMAENKYSPPLTPLPLTVEPLTAQPLTANPHAVKKNIEVINNNPPIAPPEAKAAKRQRDAIPDEYPLDFEEFWKVYPRRQGKLAAFRVWQRLKLPQKRRAYLALKGQLSALTAKANDPRGNFCPHPSTWISQGRFDDDIAPAPGSAVAAVKPEGMPDHVWRKIQEDEAKAVSARSAR